MIVTRVRKELSGKKCELCLHNSFCRNRETIIEPLPCCKQSVEEQRCWRTASNSVKMSTDVLQDTETDKAESMLLAKEVEQ